MISKTLIIFVFGLLVAVVAAQDGAPAKRSVKRPAKLGHVLRGSSKGSKGCGADLFTGVYHYIAPYGTPYQATFATRLNGNGEFSISASGMSGVMANLQGYIGSTTNVVQADPYDNGIVAYTPSDFEYIDGVCTFMASADLTCGLIDDESPGSCEYSVEAQYQEGKTVVLNFGGADRLAAKN